MRVLLKLILDCDPDAAWRALQSPTAFREVALPWLDFRSDEPAGFPTTWGGEGAGSGSASASASGSAAGFESGSRGGGEHRVRVRPLGAFTVGTQAIRLDTLRSTDPREGATRILRDSGGGTGGLLAALPHLDHRMAIAPDPAGPGPDGRLRTLYRDQLIVRAGVLTPFAWYTLWAFWQWRGRRLKQLAPTWAYDPELDPERVAAREAARDVDAAGAEAAQAAARDADVAGAEPPAAGRDEGQNAEGGGASAAPAEEGS
ncbi:hypothetical protein P5G50_17590 [Leifsonia sp. F6_8S_P_1B]|uniref:Uncharacterized protein n=1 Tax=Leifsonia williamsii TaxID=3035919 RepID=A0ABT8KFP1_9MICO|nr:hypothetical protein [Leifsonia williamsii]MDN4616266.1 hypothetical protein [Leifsonia williamsii]